MNPLHFALSLELYDVLNYLTIRCTGHILDQEDPQHLTLLMKCLAASNNPANLSLANRLLTRGADLNYRNNAPYGRTALHQAILMRNLTAIAFLMQYRDYLNIHLEDYSGKDCCFYAKLLPLGI